MRIFLAEKAFPEDAAVINLDRGAHSSFVRCNVLETKVDIAMYDKGSTLIQVGRDLLANIFRARSTTSLHVDVSNINARKVR